MKEDIFADDIFVDTDSSEQRRRKNISLTMRSKHPSEETKKKMGNKNASKKDLISYV